MLQHNYNWNHLTVAGALTFEEFFFRLYPGTMKAEQVVDFLRALVRSIQGRLLLIWDRLSAHKSWLAQELIRTSEGWIEQLWLPAYAPELNPVEYGWAHLKQHGLANVCPRDWWQLNAEARRALRKIRRRRSLIPSFWKQAKLSF